MLSDLTLAGVNGVVWGLAVALMAVGLVLTFGFLRLLNLAHGAFYALGAVVGFYAVSRLHSFGLAMALVPATVGGVGLLAERYLLRPVRGVLNGEVLITFGIAMIVEYSILLVFGGAPRRLGYPLTGNVSIFGTPYPIYRLFVGVVSLALLVGCVLVLEKTRLGLHIQATNQDEGLARALGLPVVRLTLVTFGAGTACAAFAGLMLAPIVAVEFRMGADIMAISFLVTILGGLTRVWWIGTVAVASAVFENVIALWLDPLLTRGVLLFILFAALLAIYGRKDRRRSV
ncbi:MAG: branched-chain amino acid ABC transporter permease [Acidobacteriota bacterium]